MQMRSLAPIVLLIALSGCSKKVEASDAPAIVTDPELVADIPEASGDVNKGQSQRPMQSPAAYD